MDPNIPQNQTFTPESLKKQFRLSEFLAEKIISSVAFLSIAMIVLIFVFVFKESLPLFSFGNDSKAKTETLVDSDSEGQRPEAYGTEPAADKPETYGSEPVTQEDLKPETYGSEPVSQKDLQPESYGDAATEPAVANDKPESYGDVVAEVPNEMPAEVEASNDGADNTWGSFFSTEWVPVSDNPRFGLLALLIGTLKVTIIAMLIAGPIAVLAALYTSTFASKRAKEIIKPIIELLAAFPSVVIGFFALMVLATFFQDVFGYETRLNAFVGGVAMALAAIPIIYTISEDALSAVPKTYTEASLALGASKWQTAFFVTLPAAIPGIFAALLLGVGRVFGETMIALMATGNAALISANPFDSVRTFAATIGSEMAETVFGDTHYSVLFFIGSLLFIFSFGLNALAEFYVKGKLLKKFQGN
ncbi:phosphate ABC transporter permease subunit PstC [Flavobacterium sp. GT3R68]|uniref:phosphate ABC transporter permease subunit PstC n=1 Tax=Flavobacterium sp. GT3R68 TaxID=2594437 RepID=UPI000F88D300|nr:phosphate ABC transporter permease subunit PstC [Flavobacterium sp. GT3R68]RTY91351.1 phosphate ABC transporter permease subunit PstC [Flavobacterium sp. GSN2]TRW93977.1 phosphate ABC transporter permease subunit PstC [Flavobacterium sp. GT3R68]